MEEWAETIELEGDRWITLEFSREWPKYVVLWSVRQRAGDGDFPLGNGRVEHMPPEASETVDEVFDSLRTEAEAQARAVAPEAPAEPKRTGFFSRIFGRS